MTENYGYANSNSLRMGNRLKRLKGYRYKKKISSNKKLFL